MKTMTIQIIFLVSSLILNSFLLIYLFGVIPFSLFISILFNLATIYYINFLIQDRKKFQEEFDILLNKNEIFLSHLEQVYELETFYGDEDLESLVQHARKLVKDYYFYENQNFILEEDEEEEIIYDRTSRETKTKDEEEESAQKEKSIFHEDS